MTTISDLGPSTIRMVLPGQVPSHWAQAYIDAFAAQGLTLVTGDEPAHAGARYALAFRPVPGVLGAMPHLRALFSFGAGVDAFFDDVDLPDVPLIKSVTPTHAMRMTEYITGYVLAHHREMARYAKAQSDHAWKPKQHAAAHRRTVGFLGFGRLGQHAGAVLKQVGFNVIGWRASNTPIEGYDIFSGQAGLPAFLGKCDFMVCLLPLTPETEGIMNSDLFAALPDHAVIIHAGRGPQLVEADLINALDDKQIAHAVIDVFAQEPLPEDNPLWARPDATITPHIASAPDGEEQAVQIAEAIRKIEAGEQPDHVVDRTRGY